MIATATTDVAALAARATRNLETDVRASARVRALLAQHAAPPLAPDLEALMPDQHRGALDAYLTAVEQFEACTGIAAADRLADRTRHRAVAAVEQLADATPQTAEDLLVLAHVANVLGQFDGFVAQIEALHDAIACGARGLARLAA